MTVVPLNGTSKRSPPAVPMKTGNQHSNLDILRAIGVLFVFFFHLANGIMRNVGPKMLIHGFDTEPFGRGALLMFFVHTTYVLMQSLERSERAGEGIWGSFFIRRAFRIYPLSIACILAVLAFHIPRSFFSGPFQIPEWRALVANLLLYQNLAGDASVTLPLWTLPYEVQIYAVLPLIYFSLRYSRSVKGAMLWFAGSFALCALASFWSFRIAYLLQFMPCFMAGAIAYKLQRRGVSFHWKAWCWPVYILAMVAAYGFIIDTEHVAVWSFSYRNLLAGSGLCLAVGWMLPGFDHATNRFLVGVTRWIAQHSYGIYLTHISILWFVLVRLNHTPLPLRLLSLVSLLLILPVLCFRLIEQPMIGLGRRLARAFVISNKSLAAGA